MTDDRRLEELERKIERLLAGQTQQHETLNQISRDVDQLRTLIETRSKQFDNKIQYVIHRLSLAERLKGLKRKLSQRVVSKPAVAPSTASRPTPDPTPLDRKKQEIESLPLEISVVMNWECNYHCSYCFAQKPLERSEFRKHSAREWEEALLSMYRKHGKCRILLTGGEPLFYPDAVDLVIRLSRYHHISLGTNLSVDKETLRRIAVESDLQNLLVSSSFHLEHTPIDPFMEKCLLLKEHGVTNWSSAVAYPEYLDQMPRIKNQFEEKGLGIGFFPYLGLCNGRNFPDEYSEEELSVLRRLDGWHAVAEHSRDTKKIELPRTKGVLCYAGVKLIYVDPKGDVRRCMPLDRVIGNVFAEGFSLPEAPSPCPLDVCNCEVYWKYHLK